jgi:predicted unusual protein kinase regulating ubiquinone biosynthesis (AarF/ABC1/UbiB family)
MTVSAERRSASVPASRLARLARFGLLAGELALGSAIEGARRLAGAPSEPGTNALFNVRNAQALAERLAKLRGAAMKLGQMLSMESADLLPPELAQALAMLRSGAYAMPRAQLRRVLGREYGNRWEAHFTEFDEQPIAAASIGQVHRARTTDGRELALKIQYPGVARSIDSDVDNAAVLLRLLNFLPVDLDVAGLAAEAKRQLHQEADYLREAQNLERYRRLVAGDRELFVPRVHADLTTRRILAMDFVHGAPLEVLSEAGLSQSMRDRAGAALERLLFRELFEFRFVQTDPNLANYLYQRTTGRILLLDFGSVREFPREFVARFARLTRAIIAADRSRALRFAEEIGYLAPGDPAPRVRRTLDLLFLVCEPLRHRGCYDFGRSDLAYRASEHTFLPGLTRGELRAPPPDTMFLHRKLAGSFLVCARIRARVDVRSLILPFLQAY